MEAETEDISTRGLFIRTEALLPVGEETGIRLWLPDETRLSLRGRVAHMLTPASARARWVATPGWASSSPAATR